MKILLSILIIVLNTLISSSQEYPSFGNEIDVTINGLSFDAMEPFISANGKYLFFNNLNDGINTKLFYAEKINDSTFNYIGELNGSNQFPPPHLDAVADMDSLNNFYWTSTRNYPAELDNLFHGKFKSGNVTDFGRVHGNFNKNIPGWLVMDHGISYDGQFLYYNNARFDNTNCQGPCETELGIAQKVNNSTFNKIPSSNSILENVNTTDFIYYAPCITRDNLELYYTRYQKGTITVNTRFEICVAVRNMPTDIFSIPKVLFSETIGDLIEAPSLTTDKKIMYYHRKIIGSHKIVMRYRDSPLGTKSIKNNKIKIYPNPAMGELNILTDSNYEDMQISVITSIGEEVMTISNQTTIDISSLPTGNYFLKINVGGDIVQEKFIKL